MVSKLINYYRIEDFEEKKNVNKKKSTSIKISNYIYKEILNICITYWRIIIMLRTATSGEKCFQN